MLRICYKNELTEYNKCIGLITNLMSTCENIGGYSKKYIQDGVKSFDQIPGPTSYPVVGTLHKYLPYVGDYDAEALDKNSWLNWYRYGSLVREMPGVRLLHVYDPDDIETVFRQDHRYPARRSHLAMYHYRLNKPQVYNTGGLLSTQRCKYIYVSPVTCRSNSSVTKYRVAIYEYPDENPTAPPYARRYEPRLHEKLSFIIMNNNPIRFCHKNGSEWWRLRSTFQKNFTSPQSVKNHTESTDIIVTKFVQWLKEKKVTYEEDFLPYLNRVNLEVIGIVAFNERFQSFSPQEQDSESRSSKTIDAAFGSNSGIMKLDKGFLWKLFKTPLYKRLVDSQEYLEKVSTEIMLNKTQYFESVNGNDSSLLGSFLKQPTLDFKDIIGMMVDILMAAIDTTAYTTSFVLYHISRNPEVQKRMFSEIVNLLPTKDDKITSEVVSKAVYVRSCIKESLRLNPVSIGVGRVAQKDFVLRDYLIPNGTVILTQNMVASRLPQYIRDPLSFKPERWLRGSDSYENIHPFLSLPFGFGPRSCIARRLAEQNMCIILIRLIREFEIKWMGGQLGIRTLLINKPDQSISLSFATRNS